MISLFKNNLRAELDYLGLTVKELSAKTGIAKGTLDCYLGVRASMPPADAAVTIAKHLGVSVEYLVTGKTKTGETLPRFKPSIRSLLEMILEFDEKKLEIMMALAQALKKQQKD
jgi:transcriptional regulator with XRE-family HTH domain